MEQINLLFLTSNWSGRGAQQHRPNPHRTHLKNRNSDRETEILNLKFDESKEAGSRHPFGPRDYSPLFHSVA